MRAKSACRWMPALRWAGVWVAAGVNAMPGSGGPSMNAKNEGGHDQHEPAGLSLIAPRGPQEQQNQY